MGEPTLFPSILNLLATAAFRALRFCLFRESPWAVIPRVLSLPQIILEFTVMFKYIKLRGSVIFRAFRETPLHYNIPSTTKCHDHNSTCFLFFIKYFQLVIL